MSREFRSVQDRFIQHAEESQWGEAFVGALISSMFAPVIFLDPREPGFDRAFSASFGCAFYSAFGFGGLLFQDPARVAIVAIGAGSQVVVGFLAANPIIIPSLLGVLSLVGFAWSVVLYRQEVSGE